MVQRTKYYQHKIQDSRSYTNTATISNHKPVIRKINITLNFDRKIQRPKKINIERLPDPNIESEYKNLLHSKIGQNMRLNDTNQEIWHNLAEAIKVAKNIQ